MAFTTINKSTDYFNTKLWTGNATNGRAITGVGFQPDLAWIKNRSTTDNHALFDAIRGATYRLPSNSTGVSTQATNSLASFDSDGFTLNDGGDANGSGENIVGWNWKANGQGSSNTDGSINTTYTSANTTSGFSIIQYTGNATAGATIGHGLGKVPEFIIFRRYAQAENWGVYHKSIGAAKSVRLNENGASANDTTALNSTAPTSSLITLGTNATTNVSGNPYIAYAFAPIQGFSKFGSYAGNGNADGTFVYTGFKPSFFMIKEVETIGDWHISFNNIATQQNPIKGLLYPNLTGTDSDSLSVDFLANGVKNRTSGGGQNESGKTYIYMAFAAAPLVGTNNVSANAR